jgi:hypothetical protein
MKTFLHDFTVENVVNSDEAHPLMMSHERLDDDPFLILR